MGASMLRKTKFSKAFSLTELMVVIFIFSMIILIGSSSLLVGFITGRTQSANTYNLNKNLNSVFSYVNGQMNSAGKVAVGGNTIYGFRVINANLVVFGSNDGTGCNYLAKSGTALYTKSVSTCSATYPESATGIASTGQQLSPSSIDIMTFDNGFGNTSETKDYETGLKNSPYLYISVVAQDKKNTTTSTMENTYTLNYGTVSKF